jgi:predicted DsbA family dithiol-disulfide isomerase
MQSDGRGIPRTEPSVLQLFEQPGTAIHWYDFICPFCYVGQNRNRFLTQRGIEVTDLPMQAHPEVPDSGVTMGERHGPIYEMIEEEAIRSGLPLRWPRRLPNSRQALSAAEWIRRHDGPKFDAFQKAIFAAHFALGEQIDDPSVIDRYTRELKVDLERLRQSIRSGEASRPVSECERLGRRHGVEGTPAWLIAGQLISGLQSPAVFERMANLATGASHGSRA